MPLAPHTGAHASTLLGAWAQVIERGYEGYVAKDEASLYEAGGALQSDEEAHDE